MQIYRWFYNQIYRQGTEVQGQLHLTFTFKLQWQNWNNYISFKIQALPTQKYRSESQKMHYTFWQKLWHLSNRGSYEQLFIWSFWRNRHELMRNRAVTFWAIYIRAVTDILRNRAVTFQTWATFLRYRSSDETDLQSDLQPILRANLHKRSTSRSARQSTRSTWSTRNLPADLQAAWHWWVQTTHKFFISRIQFPSDLSIHKKCNGSSCWNW